MRIRPLNNSIIFTFVDDAAAGKFIPKTASGILMTNQDLSHQSVPRWGQAIAIGKNVVDVKVDDYILIEPLMWTQGVEFEGTKIWKTDETKVVAITNDESATIQL